ncbi:MAG: hypothetical protein HZB40_06875 [Rhodocyclales bacterium]|nr:hypothetical protein [Rhodocyclales bacterium]
MEDSTTDLLLKADALMRRTRSYVASRPPSTPPAETATATAHLPAETAIDAAVDDDVPVLTEKVTDSEAALATAPPHMQEHLDALREELALWLERELPDAVLKVTDGLADQLMGELTHQAEKNLLPRLIARLDGTGRKPD